MKKKEAKVLLEEYLSGTCTADEKALIETWYLKSNTDDKFLISEQEREEDINQIHNFLSSSFEQNRFSVFKKLSLAAAAIVLIAMSFSFYFVFEKISNKEILSKAQSIKKEILPGGNKAVLTLSDGSKINLDSTVNGEVAAQSGINIYKTNDGQLIYKIVSSSEPENKRELLYNTISTPNGGQYQINLPDGTRVWLNAASSLRYPIGFNDKERTIQLTGEAYFEVAKIIMPDGSLKPFKVISENQTVEVLGTHFNINAYTDEPFVRTTLLEGKVSVSTSLHDQKILSPGQQSVVKDQIDVKNVDAREEVAWKNGLFRFNSQNIASIMRQIARWYDVEVIYKGNITEETFSGSISKYANVTEVLKMLELTGFVHFKIEGSSTDTERRIIVMR